MDQATAQETKKDAKELPYTISVLDAPNDGKVYVVGTAHFSEESQKEVAELIRRVRPTTLVLELCQARCNILELDEETVLRQAREMTTSKMIELIKKHSVVHGLLQSLLIRLYAKVTEELGMAPGGEFRVAYREAMKIGGCKVVLGDMPINVTLKRGFSSLPWYRKLKLGWMLLTTDHKLTKEDIEEMKKSDMLDTMVKEFGATFPEFKRVLIDERDMYLTQSLRNAYKPIRNDSAPGGLSPACVVGVVGLGHVAGIKANWTKQFDIQSIIYPPPPKPSRLSKYGGTIRYTTLLGIAGFIAYQVMKSRAR